MKNVSESLAGRADVAELETLSFKEIQAALPQTELEAAIVRGGFPENYMPTQTSMGRLSTTPIRPPTWNATFAR